MEKGKLAKMLRKMALAIAATGISLLALTGCGQTTVDLNKYITIETSGYDSIGTASVSFDYDAFNEDYSGKIKLKTSSKEKEAQQLLELLTDGNTTQLLISFCVETQLSQYNNLSNGDTITLEWDCEDEAAAEYFNCKLEYSSIEYTVSNLEEVGSFNPFDYVEVGFSGISPNGQIEVNADSSQAEMQWITFSSDADGGLGNGDVVTVTANLYGSAESFVQQFGAVLEQTESSFTVEGLPSYVATASEIPVDTLEKMKSQAEDVIWAETGRWNWNELSTMEDVTYIGNIFLMKKTSNHYGSENVVYLVYKILVHTDFTEPVDTEYYYVVGFYDLLLKDGECIVDIMSYVNSGNTLNEEFYIKGTIKDGAGRDWVRSSEFKGLATMSEVETTYITGNREYYAVENNLTE